MTNANGWRPIETPVTTVTITHVGGSFAGTITFQQPVTLEPGRTYNAADLRRFLAPPPEADDREGGEGG